MTKYLLDTTVLIDHLRGQQETVNLLISLAHQGHQMGVCCVNVAELYSGLSDGDRSKADHLIGSLDYYDLDSEAAKQAGGYRFRFARQGVVLSTTDTLVAAAAIAQDAILITANVKDYPMKEIRLLDQGA